MSKFIDLLLPWWWGETKLITDSFISVIFLTFIVFLAILLWKTFRQGLRIDGLSKTVDKYNRPAEPSIGQSLKDEFKRNQLAEVWQEFSDSLIKRPWDENQEVLYKTDDASLFFSEDRLLDQHFNLRFWNSVPALLVGLGILGTFVGLVWGLIPIQGVFDARNETPQSEATEVEEKKDDELKEMREAIKTLLSGVSTAFVTSVWGMLTSLLFNGLEKWRIGRVSRAISNLQRALDRLFTLKTEEEIALQSQYELEQQTKALKSFSTDLANEIKSAMVEGRQEIIRELQKAPEDFGSAMATQLAPSLDSLNTAVEELRQQKEESSTDAIQRLVEEFRESLSGSATAQLEGLAETVRSASDSLTALPEQLTSMMTSVQEQIDQSRQLLSATSEDQTEQLQSLMDGMLNAFQSAVGLQQSNLSEATNQSIQALQSTIAQLQESITSTASKISNESASMTDNMRDRFEQTANRLGESVQDAEKRVSTLLGQQSGQIEAVNAQLENSHRVLERSREMLQLMDAGVTGMRDITDAIRVSTDGLTTGADRLENAGEQLTQASRAFNEENKNYLTANSATLKQLQDALVQSRELLNDFAQRFQTIDAGLQRIFEEIQRGLTEYTTTSRDAINEYLSAFSTQLTSAANALAGSVEALGDNVEVLNDMIEGIRQR